MSMFKVLDEVCEPKRATKYSSCIDLFAREDVVIGAGETKIVPLGVKIDEEKLNNIIRKQSKYLDGFNHVRWDIKYDIFKKSHSLELKCRSSLTLMEDEEHPSWKHLHIANGSGEIDLDYPKEIGIILHNPLTMSHVLDVISSFFAGAFKAVRTGTFDGINLKSEKLKTVVKKGEKIAQIKLVEHKSYLMGYESDTIRDGGFGSSDKVTLAQGIDLGISSPSVAVSSEADATLCRPDFIQGQDGDFVCNIEGKHYGKIFIKNHNGKLEFKK